MSKSKFLLLNMLAGSLIYAAPQHNNNDSPLSSDELEGLVITPYPSTKAALEPHPVKPRVERNPGGLPRMQPELPQRQGGQQGGGQGAPAQPPGGWNQLPGWSPPQGLPQGGQGQQGGGQRQPQGGQGGGWNPPQWQPQPQGGQGQPQGQPQGGQWQPQGGQGQQGGGQWQPQGGQWQQPGQPQGEWNQPVPAQDWRVQQNVAPEVNVIRLNEPFASALNSNYFSTTLNHRDILQLAGNPSATIVILANDNGFLQLGQNVIDNVRNDRALGLSYVNDHLVSVNGLDSPQSISLLFERGTTLNSISGRPIRFSIDPNTQRPTLNQVPVENIYRTSDGKFIVVTQQPL